jgi:hypothetical protein
MHLSDAPVSFSDLNDKEASPKFTRNTLGLSTNVKTDETVCSALGRRRYDILQ